MVIKCATYASVNPFLHNFEAQLNTFLCAEGLYCTQYGLITRAEGLGVGEGRGIVERGVGGGMEGHPTTTLCSTSLNTSNGTLSFPGLN